MSTREFQPVLFKWANFSNSGQLRIRSSLEKKEAICLVSPRPWAWIGKRLRSDQVLSIQSANTLSDEINKKVPPCVAGIGLDIEPFSKPPNWLLSFAKTLKQHTRLPIVYAIPPISELPLKGLSWKSKQAEALIQNSAGVDLMLYDTGIKKIPQYQSLITSNISWAKQTLARYPNTIIGLGFPAYEDKTMRHNLKVENPKVVLSSLQQLDSSLAKTLCHRRLRLLFYAGWTLDQSDLKIITKLESWRKDVCKK